LSLVVVVAAEVILVMVVAAEPEPEVCYLAQSALLREQLTASLWALEEAHLVDREVQLIVQTEVTRHSLHTVLPQ
jgi:hypothetical protein